MLQYSTVIVVADRLRGGVQAWAVKCDGAVFIRLFEKDGSPHSNTVLAYIHDT